MSLLFLSFFGFVALLLCIFVWSLWNPGKREDKLDLNGFFEDNSRSHVNYMPQIRQALTRTDNSFLVQKAGESLARRVQRERKAIALSYLAALQDDFEELLRKATLIALLSPEVMAVHEFERIRLSLEFSARCTLIRVRLFFGSTPVPQLSSLSDVVSGLTVRVESSMRELAERAAQAAELASPVNGRGIDSV